MYEMRTEIGMGGKGRKTEINWKGREYCKGTYRMKKESGLEVKN